MQTKQLIYKLILEALKEQNAPFNLNDLCMYIFNRDRLKEILIYNGAEMLKEANESWEEHWKEDPIWFFHYAVDEHMFVGYIYISQREEHEGNCMGAFEVGSSAVDKAYQGKKVGRLLYGMAMVAAYPDPIMSDRELVSDKARNMWKSLEKNPKIEKLPSGEGEYGEKFDDEFEPETPPKDDDCELHNIDYLDKAYKYTATPENKALYDQMIKNHKIFIEKLSKRTGMGSDEIIKYLDKMGGELFDKEYEG